MGKSPCLAGLVRWKQRKGNLLCMIMPRECYTLPWSFKKEDVGERAGLGFQEAGEKRFGGMGECLNNEAAEWGDEGETSKVLMCDSSFKLPPPPQVLTNSCCSV